MRSADLLVDGLGRVAESVHAAVEGLDPGQLAWRADSEANSIAWLVWHLTRVQDDHIAEVAGQEQVWTAGGWAERFGLPFDPSDIGYGHSSDDVAKVQADSDLLTGYHGAVREQSVSYVENLTDQDLDRVVDENWDPPVTLAVRLISVLNDDLQHAGQAAFLRGLVLRR